MANITQWWSNHTEYYYDAFNDEYRDIWRGLEVGSEELYWRCYYRALVAFLRSDPDAIIDRRRLLYSYLAPEFKTMAASDTLNRYRKQLPVASTVRRVVRNICTAYDEEPERMFGDDSVQAIMDGLYEEMRVASQFQRMYHRARMTGMVAVRPLYINGRWHVDYMTPDQFIVQTDPDDWRTVSAFTYPESSENGISYVTWTADSLIRTGYNGRVISEEENRYERIPFVMLRLSDEDGVYSGGMIELVESQLDINKDKWLSNINVTFTGSPVWFAINMNTSDLTLSPDKIISVDGVVQGEGMQAPPELMAVSPETAYQEIEDFARDRERFMQQDEGIPASMVADNGGQPPSGVARLIERQELREIRESDQKQLREFEREFANMTALVARLDAGVGIDENRLEFSIRFAEESVVMEPADEYALDKEKGKDGIIDPAHFVRKWSGYDGDDYLTEVARRRDEWKAMFGGSAPALPEPPTPEPPTPTVENANPQDMQFSEI